MGTTSKLFFTLGAFGLALSFGTVSRAFGDPSTQAAAQQAFIQSLPSPTWANEAQFHVCDQACMLSKANENLSMQALYLVTRIRTIQDKYSIASQNNDKNMFGEVVRELWSYCGDRNPSSASQDDARACLKTYIQAKSLDLQAMKAAIIQNRTAEMSYKSNASQPFMASSEQQPTAKFQQYARAPTQEELTAEIKAQEADMVRLGGNSFAQWAAALPRAPNREDYCKTVPAKDPEDPTKTIQLKDADSSGVCRSYEDTKFQADQKRYLDLRDPKNGIPQTPSGGALAQGKFDTARYGDADQVNKQAYKAARNEFTSKSNQTLVTGVREMSFGQSGSRSTAAAAAANQPMDANGNVKEVPLQKSMNRDLHTTRYLPEDIESFLQKIDTSSKALDDFIDHPHP